MSFVAEGPRDGGQRGHFQPEGAVAAEFSGALHRAFPKERFNGLGLFPWISWRALNPPNRRRTDSVCPVVWEGRHREMSLYPD